MFKHDVQVESHGYDLNPVLYAPYLRVKVYEKQECSLDEIEQIGSECYADQGKCYSSVICWSRVFNVTISDLLECVSWQEEREVEARRDKVDQVWQEDPNENLWIVHLQNVPVNGPDKVRTKDRLVWTPSNDSDALVNWIGQGCHVIGEPIQSQHVASHGYMLSIAEGRAPNLTLNVLGQLLLLG
jgi:hypothetical protein